MVVGQSVRTLVAKRLLMLTDASVSTEEAVWAYYGRTQIEVAIADGKALGLDQYRGRRHAGMVRWPMLIGVVHSLLQLLAVGALALNLPRQGWPWYRKETNRRIDPTAVDSMGGEVSVLAPCSADAKQRGNGRGRLISKEWDRQPIPFRSNTSCTTENRALRSVIKKG